MKYLKKFLALLPAIVFCLYLGAAQHDDGLLDELTPVQQEQVIQMLDDVAQSTESVAVAMNEFTNHPERESEMIERLLDVSDEYLVVTRRFYSHPAFYSRGSALPEGRTFVSYVEKIDALLLPAGERMRAELIRRRESDDFEYDQAGYERMRKLFTEITDDSDLQPYCTAQTCFWCYLRNHWKMN